MNTKQAIVWTSVAMVLLAGESAPAGSIWAKRDKNRKTMYVDDVARHVGDILTVLISEDSKVDNKAKRDLQKETERSSDFNGDMGIDHVLPSMPGFTMDSTSANALKSKADFKDERSFTDRVSAVVMDILPNGNLVIVGTRDRQIAGDIQTIEISGIVRPSDVAFDNTIKSEQVANFRIMTHNGGLSDPYTRPGWLAQIMDFLWPW
jgi:flagellar L-ring protein precursor FlgH